VPCAEEFFYFGLPAAVSRESDGGCDEVGWDDIKCVVHETDENEIVGFFILERGVAVAIAPFMFCWNPTSLDLEPVIFVGVSSREQIVPVNVHRRAGDRKPQLQ